MIRVFYFFIILLMLSASASAKITVYGKLTGINGKPISVAHVFLTYPSDEKPIKMTDVQKDGKYKIVIDSEGLWVLHFTGVFHHEYPVVIYSSEPKTINLDVKLRTYNYSHSFSSVKVIGNFNQWLVPRAIKMKKDKDGTYSVIVNSKSDTVFYKLINVRTGGKVEGTNADGYIPSGVDPIGIEGYKSFMVAKKGKVKIVFDPKKIIHSDQTASFKFIPANSFESRFARAYAILEDTRQKFKSELYKSIDEHNWFKFKFNFKPFIDSVKESITSEPDSLIRQVFLLSNFQLKYISTKKHYIDGLTSRQVLDSIPPSSIIWSLEPGSIFIALNNSAFPKSKQNKYIKKILDTNPMARTKEILLSDIIDRNFHSLQYNKILPYLSILLDQYGDSPEALNEGKLYSEKYIILKKGVEAPKFSVKSLVDSSHFTNDSFIGKYYLLNFWSASNHNSIDEISNIEKAVKKIRNKKFEIVTVSLDGSSNEVIQFIGNKTNTSWHNTIEEKGLESQLCKNFEVYSIPKSILVDPKGKIVAIGWDLRGKNLLNTLRKYLQ